MIWFDYWHIRRYIRLQGTTSDDVLPFGEPPIVVGNVISLPEPVWRSAVATAVAKGVPDVFAKWKWQMPLPTETAAELLPALRAVAAEVSDTRAIVHPDDPPEDAQPDVDTVLDALRAMIDLLALGIQRTKAIETWSE